MAQACDIEEARQRFAEELRYTARVRSPNVVAAFATVPREHFMGPGPWRVLSPMNIAEYWTTDDAQPHHLYHDILIAIDPMRRLKQLFATSEPLAALTGREKEVCLRILSGFSSEAIAADLGISLHSALTYRKRAYERLATRELVEGEPASA